MDLHQAFRILPIPVDGVVALDDPDLAREASPLANILVETDSVAIPDAPPGISQEGISLAGGRHAEFTIPAWNAAVLAVHSGFCLTGTDGESPDAHAGTIVVYRRRNRGSAMILVAGPDGCRATLVIAPTA